MSHSFVMAITMRARLLGLLCYRKDVFACNRVLVLVPCNSVHTFFMRDEIDIAFIDCEGMVLRSYEHVRPCRVISAKGAAAVLERFSDNREERADLDAFAAWYKEGDRVSLNSVKP